MYIYARIYTFGQTALWYIQILKTPFNRDSAYREDSVYRDEF